MKFFTLALVGSPAVVLAIASYTLTTTIPWTPKNSTSVDLGLVVNGTYYLSDRTNAVVHVVDLATGTETGQISGFVGARLGPNGKVSSTISGPNGVLLIPDRNELYVGDGDGTVKVVDLRGLTVIDTIRLGLTKRADEMTYDTKHKVAAVTGPDEDTPVLIIVSVTDQKILGKISFPDATNGIEQPAYNPVDGLIYVSIPETKANDGGEIDVIDTTTLKIARILPEPQCSSHGIVFGPNQRLLLGCSLDPILANNVAHTLIMDITTGNITATINGIGGSDQTAYNPSTNWFYVADYQNLANGSKMGAPDPKLSIIDATTGRLIQTIVTDNVTAHSVAVDPKTNRMIVPLVGKGVAIFDLVNETVMGSGTPSGTAKPTASAVVTSGATKAGLLSIVVVVAASFVVAIAWN
jgi:WD40 repeat protein